MRGLIFAWLLLVPLHAGADVYAYGDAGGGLWLTDAPSTSARWQLLYRASDGGRRASAALDWRCVERMGNAPALASRHDQLMAEVNAGIQAAAERSKIDADLLRAVIWVESRCNHRAVSAKGAIGLMQLMPATARLYGVADAFDVRANILAGARYLRDLMDHFSGNLELALAAYNAGPRAVMAAGMRIPPFRETQAYVPAILRHVQFLKKA